MNNLYDRIKPIVYYLLIGLISLCMLLFLPFIGSEIGIEYHIPQTNAEWLVFVGTKLAMSVLNMLLFHLFVKQGKLNIEKDERYINALKRANLLKPEKVKLPRSPKAYYTGTYLKRGLTLFSSTGLALFAFGTCILRYDMVQFVTYAIILLIGIVLGVLQMKDTEEYWTIEFVNYVEREILNNDDNQQQRAQNLRGASIEE